MTSRTAPAQRKPLAMALLVALVAPGMAFAQTAKEKELEARIAQLEQQVQSLLSLQQQQQTQIAEVQEVQAKTPPPPVIPAGKQPIQVTSITPAALPGTTFKVGGFIKTDFMLTRTGDGQLADSAVGRALYVPSQTPIGGSASGTDFDAHAKFSRIGFGVDSVTDSGKKLGALVEMDFFGNSLGNQNATNTYGVTMRHAYMYWDKWLAGQTWSNFMDLSALPEAADFIGPTDGVVFVRQAQIRYTNGAFTAALENPETTLYNTTASDRGALPDLTLRYGWKGDWGTFGIAGLVRSLTVDRPGYDDSTFGGGVSVGGRWVMGSNDTLQYQLTAGEGIGRYIGLGIQSDAVLDGSNGNIDSIGVVAGYVGWRHAFSPKLRSNLIFARSDYSNDVALTGLGATSSVQSLRANLFYSPLPKVDIGGEVMYGKREIESGASGDITRLQFSTKYSF